MRTRFSFSSRRTRHLENIKKQRAKYPPIVNQIIEVSDIILEILDARFIERTRNKEIEDEIRRKKKKIIYVANKSDLVDEKKLKQSLADIFPYAVVSCTKRTGIKFLRDLIKKESKKIGNLQMKDIKKGRVKKSDDEIVKVGVIGYPNTGKSSLINLLIGKSSAGVGSDAGFTKNIQKLKLSPGIMLLDSPGVIPENDYSQTETAKIARHTIVGSRSYSQVKEPELVVAEIMKEYPGVLEEFYKLDSDGDSELLLEKLGRQKGFLKKGGEVNYDSVARFILKGWQSGKIKV